MKAHRPLIFLFACFIIAACKDDKITPQQLQGTYKGSFRSLNTASMTDRSGLLNGSAEIAISGNTYQGGSTAAQQSRGSYVISGNEIIFTDSLAHTADFNWSLLLNGAFKQSTKGDSLVWTKTLGTYNFIYTLKKQ
ncbi:hypothetical protein [Mucilaginibacter ginsenosidivorax]|uniref:Lipocalin-like domain-containing protein n=1 Tax=Mucilaginibacter ginsenosidivorax TaxID=862126 RepID=A0A5B8VYZ3_9SPHI|nr:hypothetical protein [Mucilaginibacter ginsenosidivorax]QEC75706.1 hypothetical protein FSB76_06990 [Mucilaginibacter ginsenosidivorax]